MLFLVYIAGLWYGFAAIALTVEWLGIEPATFWLLVQCRNHYTTNVINLVNHISRYLVV